MSALPGPLRRALKASKKWWLEHVADRVYFPVWLACQCLRHRQRAVVLCRIAALGDVLCTLPMAAEIKRRHPDRLFVFVTAYRKMIELAREPDAVYGSRSWSFEMHHCYFGLVEKIYAPRTTDERNPQAGAQCHLIDDLARSCGLSPADRQPRLFPSPELIRRTLAAYGLSEAASQGRWLLGINCGRTWPVRMWAADKWQQLVDRLHAEYPRLTILQFGLTKGPDEPDEFDELQGVVSVTNRLQADELVALVAQCRLLISIDSGPVHVAGAVGTPVIGLFGAVNPQLRLPPDLPAEGVFAAVPCRFCHHTTPPGHQINGCPHGIRCMRELEVATVFAAVKSLLAKGK